MHKPLILIVAVVLAGCNRYTAPDCPYQDDQLTALSAGCFSVDNGRLLLVQGLNDKISVPGGSSEPQESAQCTAFRETWEETGLKLQPQELLLVFDTGFHLYRCQRHKNSGEIDPPPRMEVQAALYLTIDDFDKYQWRYPQQQALIKQLLRESLAEIER